MTRFLNRVWDLAEKAAADTPEDPEISLVLHQTIKKVTDDIEAIKFNTAVAQLMTLTNALSKADKIRTEDFELFLKLLAPFAPHIAEEIWHRLGHETTVTLESWPAWEEAKLAVKQATIVVQVNGKLRARFEIDAAAGKEEIENAALENERIQQHLQGKTVRKVIVIPGKLVNIVAS
jgi:leucyl-tRNA synthetase